jgi:hypothetical protein
MEICDIMKKTTQRDQCYNLELLGDELGHRLRQNYNQQKNFIGENKAKGSVDSLEVVERATTVEKWHVVEKEDDRKMRNEKHNRQTDSEGFQESDIP